MILSVAFPRRNCRPDIGMKTAKRLITDNTALYGQLNTNKFQRAILQFGNAPDQDTKLSPAIILFTVRLVMFRCPKFNQVLID